MTLTKHKQYWEDLGEIDPYWAILTHPARKYGRWDLEEFFLTGEQEVQSLMEAANRLGFPGTRDSALDFGCGVGRLTRALSKRFKLCCGVDISFAMLGRARKLNEHFPGCAFVLNDQEHLQMFRDNSFDMIYSNIVLQHMPRKDVITAYVSEFFRLLKKDGLLVFQLPSRIPLSHQIHEARAKVYRLLRSSGFEARLLHEKLGLSPMSMACIPEDEVRALLTEIGARVLDVRADSGCPPSFRSRSYYLTK